MRPLSAARRRRAEALMTDRCRVVRRSSAPSVGPDGRDTWTETTVYEGRCKIQAHEAYEQTPEGGGHTYVVQRYRVDLPHDAPEALPDDRIEVAGYGRPYRVTGGLRKSHLTAQRLSVEVLRR